MNPLDNLAHYLDRLERRLRLFAWARGAAAVLGAALGLTLVIVAALIYGSFSHTGLIFGRFVLFLGVGGAIALMLIVPLLRLNRRRAAQEVERRQPGFDQRLLTFTEKQRDNPGDPFLPLLADDASKWPATISRSRSSTPNTLCVSLPSAPPPPEFCSGSLLGPRRTRLRHCSALGQPAQRPVDTRVFQRFGRSRLEDHPPQKRPDHHRAPQRLRRLESQSLGAIRQRSQVGRSAHAAPTATPSSFL